MSGCTVCTHPQFDAITAALSQGVSLRTIEETHGVSRSALSRHTQEYPDDRVAPDPNAPVVEAGPLPTTRLRTCPICQLPDEVFERLEAAFGTSAPSQSLALEYGVGMSDMTYHAQHRQSEALSRQRYEAEQHQAPADDP